MIIAELLVIVHLSSPPPPLWPGDANVKIYAIYSLLIISFSFVLSNKNIFRHMHCPPSGAVIEARTWVFFGCTLTVKLALINFIRDYLELGIFKRFSVVARWLLLRTTETRFRFWLTSEQHRVVWLYLKRDSLPLDVTKWRLNNMPCELVNETH